MRIILFTGKGGVGKTSSAAATALLAARRGIRTVVISTDPAHSLGDSLDIPLGEEPRPIADHLDALEINPYWETESYWGHIQRYLASLMVSQGVDQAIAGELASLPGLGELFSLVRLARFDREQAYDLAIVDCAPTGESLRLLNLPQVLSKGLGATRKLDRFIIKPVLHSVMKVASSLSNLVPDEGVTRAWNHALGRLSEICDLLTDPQKTSVRLVMNPEKMVIKESQRALTNLNLYGITVDAVVVNRVLGAEARDGYMAGWYARQQAYLAEIDRLFYPIPIRTSPLFPQEVVGTDALLQLGTSLWGHDDPTAFFYSGKALQLEREGEDWRLVLHLPLVAGEEVAVHHLGNEMSFVVKGKRYHVALPEILAGMEPGHACLREGRFTVPFHSV